jgi:hypothetical protein
MCGSSPCVLLYRIASQDFTAGLLTRFFRVIWFLILIVEDSFA